MLGPFTLPELLGAVVTCILAGLTYRASVVDVRKQRVALVAATCVLLTLLLSVRFDLLPRIEDDIRLNRLGEANSKTRELFALLSKLPTKTSHPLMNYILQIRLTGLNQFFEDLRQGRFVVDQAGLPEFLMDMIKSAKTQIVATSYAQPASWWDQPWGKRYEAENEQAVKRGVRVTRTFLFANQSELDQIRPLLMKEVASGITVKYAFISDLHTNLVNGLVVVDNGLAGELHLTPSKGVKEAEFYTRPSDIEAIRDKVYRVQSEAQELVASAPEKSGAQ